MTPEEILRQMFPDETARETTRAPTASMGSQQISNALEEYSPLIKQLTGKSPKEVIMDAVGGLIGGVGTKGPEPIKAVAKPTVIEKYVNVQQLAIWIPVCVVLTGSAVLVLYLLAKFIFWLAGVMFV